MDEHDVEPERDPEGISDSATTPDPETVPDPDTTADLTVARDPWREIGTWFSFGVVALCCAYIFWVVHPKLLFRDTTPTGGDMGAHVWGPAYLRDVLLPHLRLTGWTNDWYAGFPAYTFYMVVPSLLIVALDVGFISTSSIFGALLAIALIGASAYVAWRLREVASRMVKAAGWTACVLVPLLCINLPYNVAFKLVTVSGLVAFPAGVWFLLRSLSLRRPGPELGAIVSVAFLMDKSLFHIYGGNVASTMAGEFAFSMSLTLSLFALGAIAMGLRTGRYRARASVLVALAMLCHVIPGVFFLGVGAIFLVVLRPRLASVKWALPVAASGGLMAMWWYIPFYGNSSFLNDMGWEKLGVDSAPTTWMQSKVFTALRAGGATANFEQACDVVRKTLNWGQIQTNLLPLAPHHLNGSIIDEPNMWGGRFFFVLAGVGAALSLVMVVRSGIWLTMVTATAALAFVIMPQDRFWNARVLPFYYLGIYLLAAVGFALLLKAVGLLFRGRWVDPPLFVSIGVTALSMLVLWAALGMTLRTLPGGQTLPDGKTYHWMGFDSTYQGPVRDWAKWNYEGLESKPGTRFETATDGSGTVTTVTDTTSSQEFFGMINTMKGIGETNGCGRAYWEYGSELEKYGTPMAPMLLPYFTNHCIGSMEGLYFEASSTTPFHFLVQSELSKSPSRPERFDCHLGFDTSPYKDFNLDQGIKHLQMLGVRYFMAITEPTKAAAKSDPRLKLVGTSGPWQMYEVSNIDLVSPLKNMPVVWNDVQDGIHSYARPAVDWFNDESQWNVLRATDGPANWKRVSKNDRVVAKRAPSPNARISNVTTTSDSISFHVDKIGTPVLIRTSYFPNWNVDGADGVYRVTPNQMVVVPTSKIVTLTYGRSGIEWISALMSLIGFALFVWMLRGDGATFAADDVPGEFFGDRDPPPADDEVEADDQAEAAGEPEPGPEVGGESEPGPASEPEAEVAGGAGGEAEPHPDRGDGEPG